MAKKKKRSNNPIFLYLAIAVVLVLIWLNYHSKKIQVLKKEEYAKTYEANAIVIKNEEVINVNGPLEFSVKEGERVSINKIISESDISFTDYYHSEIDIINWILENKTYQESNLFQKDITDIDAKLKNIESEIGWAEKFNKEKFDSLNKEKEELLDKKRYILKAFQYLGADEESLLNLREEYANMEDNISSSITLKRLNFNFPGYIYFKSDGYENILSLNILEYLTPEYIESIQNRSTGEEGEGYQGTIKVVDDSFMYLGLVLPKDFELTQESKALTRKAEVIATLETDKLSHYYDFLNTRFDVVKSFPTIQYEYEGAKDKGYIVDIREYGEKKVLILQVRNSLNKELLTKRNISLNLYTFSRNGYVVPEKSIIKVDGKDNIVIMSKGYLKKYIEVNITKKYDKEVFLQASENKNITDGMQLIMNP